MSQLWTWFVGGRERRENMKTKILFVSGFLAVGLFTITVHENQVEIIEQQDAHIRSLEKELESRDQYVSELEKTLEKEREKLTELSEKNRQLEERIDSLLKIEATGYTPKCVGCSGITFTGIDVRGDSFHEGKRIIAVDPEVIPLETTVKVHTGDGSFLATTQDVGGDIEGHRIDVLFQSKKDAQEFGRQDVVVEIIE
jgi:3D (Asp-Asp-Asp) domain-containing protein